MRVTSIAAPVCMNAEVDHHKPQTRMKGIRCAAVTFADGQLLNPAIWAAHVSLCSHICRSWPQNAAMKALKGEALMTTAVGAVAAVGRSDVKQVRAWLL